MKKKHGIILAAVLLVLVAAVFTVGCNPSQVVDYKVGDKIGDGFVITFVDSAGGWEAQKQDDGGNAVQEDGLDIMKVSGVFTEDRTWAATAVWYLENLVFIGDDTTEGTATLTIDAGTLIKGISSVTPGTLVITRNSMISANGTEDDPIIMTSALPRGSRGAGDWGGLVINGNASLNVSGGTAEGEGSSGTYGGTADDDDSGNLNYVRVEYAGRVFTSEDELNGIAFQGVGSGTEVDYIQVHQNKDDGVEFFGGTVEVSHVVLTGNQDDSLDWTHGWRGGASYVVIQQYADGDRLIEADNLEDDNDATPRSAPVLANMTMVGKDGTGKGITFRRGTDATLVNSIITNVAAGDIIVEDNANDITYAGIVTDAAVDTGDAPDFAAATGEATADNSGFAAAQADTTGDDWNDDPDDGDYPVDYWTLDVSGADVTGATADTDYADFIGAVDPADAASAAWYVGWITQDIE